MISSPFSISSHGFPGTARDIALGHWQLRLGEKPDHETTGRPQQRIVRPALGTRRDRAAARWSAYGTHQCRAEVLSHKLSGVEDLPGLSVVVARVSSIVQRDSLRMRTVAHNRARRDGN